MIIYIDLGLGQIRLGSTLWQMHRRNGPYKRAKPSKSPFDGQPFMKGVVLKTVIKKPKKPNSANRKCVIVRLSNGKEMAAYVPGTIILLCLHLINSLIDLSLCQKGLCYVGSRDNVEVAYS